VQHWQPDPAYLRPKRTPPRLLVSELVEAPDGRLIPFQCECFEDSRSSANCRPMSWLEKFDSYAAGCFSTKPGVFVTCLKAALQRNPPLPLPGDRSSVSALYYARRSSSGVSTYTHQSPYMVL
jgi:hypothetical protein